MLEDVCKAKAYYYDDKAWRVLNVPHDWSVEFPFDEENGQGCTV